MGEERGNRKIRAGVGLPKRTSQCGERVDATRGTGYLSRRRPQADGPVRKPVRSGRGPAIVGEVRERSRNAGSGSSTGAPAPGRRTAPPRDRRRGLSVLDRRISEGGQLGNLPECASAPLWPVLPLVPLPRGPGVPPRRDRATAVRQPTSIRFIPLLLALSLLHVIPLVPGRLFAQVGAEPLPYSAIVLDPVIATVTPVPVSASALGGTPRSSTGNGFVPRVSSMLPRHSGERSGSRSSGPARSGPRHRLSLGVGKATT